MNLRLLMTLFAVIAALGLAACGGDDDDDSGDDETTTEETTEETTTSSTTSTTTTTTDDAMAADDYEDELNSVIGPLGTDLQAMGSTLDTSSPEALTKGLEDFQGTIDDGTAQLSAITPPPDVADIHEELISTFEDFSGSISKVVTAIQSGDQQAAAQAAQDFQADALDFQTRLTDVQADYTAAGINVE